MSQGIKNGDTISVNYTGRFEDGEVFDSSEGRDPLKFTVGAGQLIKGFDDAVLGMDVGESKSITILPEDGYGTKMEDLMFDMPNANIPEDMAIETGMTVQLSDQSGNPVPAVVAEILDDVVKLDLNHPLAGKTLTFDIEIIETGLEPEQQHDCSCCSGGCDQG